MVTTSYNKKSCIFLVLKWLQNLILFSNAIKVLEMLYIINIFINDTPNMSLLRYFSSITNTNFKMVSTQGQGAGLGPFLGHNFLIFDLISTIVGSNTLYSSRWIYWRSNINDTTIMRTDIHVKVVWVNFRIFTEISVQFFVGHFFLKSKILDFSIVLSYLGPNLLKKRQATEF